VRQQAEQPRGVGGRHEDDDQETVADKKEVDGVGLSDESEDGRFADLPRRLDVSLSQAAPLSIVSRDAPGLTMT
jgi:hypothetical protein